jgi:hypothetical protein
MINRMASRLLIVALVATSAATRATETPLVPLPLTTTYAFSARVTLAAPVVIGQSPEGLRRFVAITGGSVSGPMLTGKVLAGSGDWQVVRSDGVVSVEARYTIETADGIRIAVINRGLRDASAAVAERIMRGDVVAPNEYYFRTVAQFEAPIGSKYEWMNKMLFACVAERKNDAAILHFYRLN